jgi:hypothetical protein
MALNPTAGIPALAHRALWPALGVRCREISDQPATGWFWPDMDDLQERRSTHHSFVGDWRFPTQSGQPLRLDNERIPNSNRAGGQHVDTESGSVCKFTDDLGLREACGS